MFQLSMSKGFFVVLAILSFFIVPTAYAQNANLMPNGSFETASGAAPQGWSSLYWGTPAPTFSYPAAGNAGTKGASVTLSANSTGDAAWRVSAPISVTPGTKYTFTTWYNSNVVSEIDAEYISSSGATSYAWLADVPSSGGVWKQITLQITIPSGVSKATIYQLIYNKGTLTVDDVSFANTSGTTPPSTPTVSISASPASISAGQSSTLAWSSTNTTSCSTSGGWSGTRSVAGTTIVSPSVTTTYTITCTGAGGSISQSATVSVTNVTPTPTLTLSASPTSIVSGQSSTLTWSTTNVTTCTASGAWSGSKTTSGSASVAPTANSSYTLTCSGTGGSISKTASITVTPVSTNPNQFSEGMVTLSFDDAWASQYTNALPILKNAGLLGTFYMISSVIQGSWQDYMTPSMVQGVANAGHEIAGHTVSHPDLPTLSSAQITNEITASRTYLQNLTGKPVTSLAYPYGSVNATVKNLTSQAGYSSGRGVDDSQQNTPKTDKYNLFGQCIEKTDTLASIKAQIDKAKASKTWYILCFHEIRTLSDQYTIPTSELQQIVDYIKQVGIKVVTVQQGRALMAN